MAKLTSNTFHASKEDAILIEKIAERAHQGLSYLRGAQSKMHTMMDLTVVNNTVGLRLQAFLDAPSFDFQHDIYGIYQNLNRQTYELEGCFLPRYAK